MPSDDKLGLPCAVRTLTKFSRSDPPDLVRRLAVPRCPATSTPTASNPSQVPLICHHHMSRPTPHRQQDGLVAIDSHHPAFSNVARTSNEIAVRLPRKTAPAAETPPGKLSTFAVSKMPNEWACHDFCYFSASRFWSAAVARSELS